MIAHSHHVRPTPHSKSRKQRNVMTVKHLREAETFYFRFFFFYSHPPLSLILAQSKDSEHQPYHVCVRLIPAPIDAHRHRRSSLRAFLQLFLVAFGSSYDHHRPSGRRSGAAGHLIRAGCYQIHRCYLDRGPRQPTDKLV